MADGDGVAGHLDLAGEAAMHAVVREQMRVSLDAAQIVDGNGDDVVPPALDNGAQHQAPDPSKTIDRDLNGHDLLPFRY
ncbi:hypothetical protein GALL_517160 [mine drainage metagenome]|uniref:Uncharacterized protein n=1 Tax=mine drainage metagenome TaxID=410659 RepID=A0A1J5P7H4_9ZZZZ